MLEMLLPQRYLYLSEFRLHARFHSRSVSQAFQSLRPLTRGNAECCQRQHLPAPCPYLKHAGLFLSQPYLSLLTHLEADSDLDENGPWNLIDSMERWMLDAAQPNMKSQLWEGPNASNLDRKESIFVT
jgi:hypothetical protein